MKVKKLFVVFIALPFIISDCANTVTTGKLAFNISTLKAGKNPGSVELADFNKDGFQDIALASTEDSSVIILLGNGKGNFIESSGSPFPANRFPNDIVIADFNMDGNLDLGIANTEVSSLTVLLGNGKGQFRHSSNSPFFVHSKPHTHGIAAGDFNGDGKPDLATDSWAENKILIIFGDGKGNFGEETSYIVGNHPYQRLRAADLNKDGKPDLVTSNLDGRNVTVLFGTGKGKFMEANGSPFSAGDSPFGIALGDVNDDGNMDIVVANSPTITSENIGKDGITILLGNGHGQFFPLKGNPFQTGKSPSRLAIGDVNADGVNDIVVTNYNDKSITILYMNKQGVSRSAVVHVGNHPDGVAIGDMNGDGKNDILVSNFDDNTVTILFQN